MSGLIGVRYMYLFTYDNCRFDYVRVEIGVLMRSMEGS